MILITTIPINRYGDNKVVGSREGVGIGSGRGRVGDEGGVIISEKTMESGD